MRIRDVMVAQTGSPTRRAVEDRRVVAVAPDTDVRQALRLMAQEQATELIVIQGEQLVGVVDRAELVRCPQREMQLMPHRRVRGTVQGMR